MIQTHKPKTCLTTNEIETRLRDAGVQPTHHRISICRHVLCDADHPTAEDVHAWAEKNLDKVSLATVYNTLNTLVEAGLLREFRFPHTDKVIFDTNLDEHYHFYDTKVEKLYDIPLEQVEVRARLGKAAQVNQTTVFFTGELTMSSPSATTQKKPTKKKET